MTKKGRERKITYAGINGGGKAPPGRPCGAPPGPGRFGIAGAARLVAGGGGGPRLAACESSQTIQHINFGRIISGGENGSLVTCLNAYRSHWSRFSWSTWTWW